MLIAERREQACPRSRRSALRYELDLPAADAELQGHAGPRIRGHHHQRRALEELIGPNDAVELLCKPYDLEQIVQAVTNALTTQAGEAATAKVPFFSSVRMSRAIALRVS